ncbi:MAG: hypothetical protein GH158_04865 [Dehalococcoidia bacterium]|nr:hypothetical protein [Dehalococcoidia bacterium]
MGYLSPTLAVRNMKETIAFYRDVLGFKTGMMFPDAKNPEYADLSKDDMVLMIIPAASCGIGAGEKLGAGVNFYLNIDGDIDEYHRKVKSKGARIITDIKDEPYGIRDFTIEDVNGYQFTFNQIVGKKCLSCGMPMSKAEDFGGGNPANVYCVHCAKPDGSLKKYEEVYEGMIGFMMNTQSMDRATAEIAAKEYMATMPAWQGK